MNKFLFLIIGLCICHAVASQNNTETIATGTAQTDQLMLADPFIMEEDGWYYIYGTKDADGIVVHKSQDLKNWTSRCGNAKKGLALHKDDVWGNSMFWAPEVYKHNGKYIMTYSSDLHICYAESESPCGPFVQKDKRPYLSDEEGIDASIFIDDNGKAYIFWVRFMKGGNIIWAAEMTPDLHNIKIETAQELIDAKEHTWEKRQGRIAEGPLTFKHKGKYYLTFSCNDFRSREYAVGYAVSDNPLGPYKRYENNPILHRHCGYFGTGHHAIFRSGKHLYMVYHAHKSHTTVTPRQTLIAPIKMRRDRKATDKSYKMEVSDKIIIPKIEE